MHNGDALFCSAKVFRYHGDARSIKTLTDTQGDKCGGTQSIEKEERRETGRRLLCVNAFTRSTIKRAPPPGLGWGSEGGPGAAGDAGGDRSEREAPAPAPWAGLGPEPSTRSIGSSSGQCGCAAFCLHGSKFGGAEYQREETPRCSGITELSPRAGLCSVVSSSSLTSGGLCCPIRGFREQPCKELPGQGSLLSPSPSLTPLPLLRGAGAPRRPAGARGLRFLLAVPALNPPDSARVPLRVSEQERDADSLRNEEAKSNCAL